ncbi:hypothetical protein QJS04_geneDACA023497 [Acorus gramineus]|uniref:Peptidase M1 leukotriene A4 hydrolase/aminopeptidase C-terminal domain-containing protein n=1 Tax=Acorus gramineus TaxID=55184 RepID=A0AAV9B2Q8_ACOGR|nr:hypothetical protein QJS04_geneDACA023497 [Acorus gramineus]
MAPIDPHSYTDSTNPLATHLSLTLFISFPTSTISATALLTLPTPFSGPLLLDTRSLSISSVLPPPNPNPIPFSLSPTIDHIKGQLLTLTLTGQDSILITYSTSPDSSALQWLNPSQTTSKTHPFVYTQCYSIHARSVFPCQDTPAARLRFSALVNLPHPLSSEFSSEFPIPLYLFALAAGRFGSLEVGPRTSVYAEAEGEVLGAAAKEFVGVEEMVRAGEGLFGLYEWGRFDLLVLPPSFPYGGMENPLMVFLTPTVIRGDGSGAQVVAHELAHSWTGNLITNKTNEDFWLNEGFTTNAERRIVEVVQGEQRAALNVGIGWKGLHDDVETFKDNVEFTKLKNKQEGIDPDDICSQIGRAKFDEFLKNYIATFKFQSIDTETFIEFLKENVPGIEKDIDLDQWFKLERMPTEDEVAYWSGQEWELYLKNLPKTAEASQVAALDARYHLSESKDWEVKVAFLQLSISCGCKNYFGETEKTLKEAGRVKYLRPLYTALVQGAGKEGEKILAKRLFMEARESYHPIAQGDSFGCSPPSFRKQGQGGEGGVSSTVSCGCKNYFGEVEKTLKEVGRMKYLRPLHTTLVQGAGEEEEKILAKRLFMEAHESYHTIAQGVVESILLKHA